ncbi:cell wall hydrolase [Paenibacillus antri]|uniref:Cell wall hydrolase n=1 Tax=Paenibacillus antri TaxID=2582848 RepID=A0A5R9G8H5_9BACL|nr:stalk domain-containing protein [Paenibacillus antri]TLS52702.1 cell wall hydrolase [Paenibacillus antri]
MDPRRKPKRKQALAGLTALFLFAATPLSAAADETMILENASVTIDGKEVLLDDPVRMTDGRLFLPVTALASLFGATVEWDGDNEAATIHTSENEKIVMRNGVPVVQVNERRYLMDVSPFLADGRTYLPFRYAAELMDASVEWNDTEKTAELTSTAEEPPALQAADPYAEEDMQLLAKIVQVEAGSESYEGQLAIANIILNRVKDSRFPNTIRDVIYSGRQFPPAHNGLLDRSEPNDSVLRATRDALDGKNNIEDAVYFYNPDVTGGAFWDRLEVVAEIGNHAYARP